MDEFGNYGMAIISAPVDKAEELARMIVERRLGACCQIIRSITSIYWWEDEIQKDAESLLLVKTKAECIGSIKELLDQNHPYDVPELVFHPITHGNREYLKWVSDNTVPND